MSKEQERAELHRTIWQIANDLRGSVDGWDFKNYVLGFLFYRFISEDLTAHLNREEAEAGNSDFDYASDVADDDIDDDIRRQTIDEKGFFIYPSELFKNVVARAEDDDNLNETLSRIFKNIEGSAIGTDSESDMKGLFSDIDVNSPKLGATVSKRNELLTKIMQKIGAMDLGGDLQDAKIDAFGDAYEFLMTMYASNAGKSGGEFFTPQEVAELLARIACDGKDKINKVYDPACGSGSLLLKFVKVLGAEKAKQVSFYGQEVNITTYNLCRINMFLHHVPFNMFDIQLGDTLTEPKHMAEIPFDAIVSNPPYSTRWAGDANPLLINDDRYSPAGVLAPKTKADLAFTMHMLHHLSTTGTAAIVEFPGVLYRGGAEQKIRQYLIENNYVDTVIQLPANLFFGVGIATCIIVLKKSKADNSVLFIDASEECVKDGNKNKLTDDNIQTVFSYYADRKDVEYKAKLVNCKDILANDCNLSVSSYVEQEDKREAIDIKTVNATLSKLIAEGNSLNAKIDSIIKEYEHYRNTLLTFNKDDDSVEWKTLGEITNISRGKRVVRRNLSESGLIPVFQNSLKPLGFTNESNYPANTTFIISAGAAGDVGYSFSKYWGADDCFSILTDEDLHSRFVYHWLKKNEVYLQSRIRGGAIKRLSRDIINELPFPSIHFSRQQEIVSILDTFEASITNLEAQLEQRQKQYEYYREELLTNLS